MEGHKFIHLLLANLLIFLSDPYLLSVQCQLPIVVATSGQIQTYIVHVVRPEGSVEFLGDEDLEAWHSSFLPNTTLDSGEPRLLYSYRHAICGFAARLAPEEVETIKAMEGFVHAEPEDEYELETTYTPKFLGLHQSSGAWPHSSFGEGIIIGVIDSGIPRNHHPSFGDNGVPPPPAKWNGTCNSTICNNKIIGAMQFHNGKKSYTVIDTGGHGTHVASIAAGNFVDEAEVLGTAKGMTSGMAPRAHLAIYRVCHPGCRGADILAGIDQAIDDGVDMITMSISGGPKDKFFRDKVALGLFAAVEKGISAVASAGNRGPTVKSLSHSAPWVTTVGASSTDRRIEATVKLGNGKHFHGESTYQPNSTTFDSSVMLPLVFPGFRRSAAAGYCYKGSLNKFNVTGKVVICWVGGSKRMDRIGGSKRIDKGKVVKDAGGAAMILVNSKTTGYTTYSEAHFLPVSHVSYLDGSEIRSYVQSSKNSTATIDYQGTSFGHRPSPLLASFSSRGPSLTNGGILKPDVLAPGVNILGAWPYNVGPNPTNSASRFNFDSGTSMAAPHVAGIIALIKHRHPDWTPAAIQSAIVTSAIELDLDRNKILDENKKTAGIFATGAGLVNPSGAIDPGLVYDLDPDDYIGYLCGLGYTDAEVAMTARRSIKCSNKKAIMAWELNYPSITVSIDSSSWKHSIVEVRRTVTNVGPDKSTYYARITNPRGVKVHLHQDKLQFLKVGEQKNFTVQISYNSFTSPRPHHNTNAGGKLEWVSVTHVVKSPIAVIFT